MRCTRSRSGTRAAASKRPLQQSEALRLSATASAIALLLGAQAHAQQPVLEEVTVTGSRITRTSGFTTAVPVTAVTTDDLSAFQPGTTIADQLDQLPQFYATESAQRGGGALFGSAGRSSLNMRALGASRTLVLLDGARLSPADRDGARCTSTTSRPPCCRKWRLSRAAHPRLMAPTRWRASRTSG